MLGILLLSGFVLQGSDQKKQAELKTIHDMPGFCVSYLRKLAEQPVVNKVRTLRVDNRIITQILLIMDINAAKTCGLDQSWRLAPAQPCTCHIDSGSSHVAGVQQQADEAAEPLCDLSALAASYKQVIERLTVGWIVSYPRDGNISYKKERAAWDFYRKPGSSLAEEAALIRNVAFLLRISEKVCCHDLWQDKERPEVIEFQSSIHYEENYMNQLWKKWLLLMAVGMSVTSSIKASHQSQPDAASGIIGFLAGAVVIGATSWWYNNSQSAQELELQQNKNTLEGVKHKLAHIRATAQPPLEEEVTYSKLVGIRVSQGGSAIAKMSDQHASFKTALHEQWRALNLLKKLESPEIRELAASIHQEFSAVQHAVDMRNDVLKTFDWRREKSVRELISLQSNMEQLEKSLQSQQLFSFIDSQFKGKFVEDNVSGYPLVMGAKVLNEQSAQLYRLEGNLREHLDSSEVIDVEAKTLLDTVLRWRLNIQNALQQVSDHKNYTAESERLATYLTCRIQARTEAAQAQTHKLEAENRARELAVRDQEARNRANQVANEEFRLANERAALVVSAVHAVATLLREKTGHACPHHLWDYGCCPHDCPHYQRYYITITRAAVP